jgi:hypothetical protein
MQFTVPIPHAKKPTVITVEADSTAQAKAKAYRVHSDASYAALSPADKLLVDKWAAASKLARVSRAHVDKLTADRKRILAAT